MNTVNTNDLDVNKLYKTLCELKVDNLDYYKCYFAFHEPVLKSLKEYMKPTLEPKPKKLNTLLGIPIKGYGDLEWADLCFKYLVNPGNTKWMLIKRRVKDV